MTSPKLSPVKDAENLVREDGFFSAQDPVLGQEITTMEDEDIPFASAGGLDFCKANVLDNPMIRSVIESFFDRCYLGLYRSIGASAGDYSFRSDMEPNPKVLIVQLWRKGSKVIYWPGSHRHYLDPMRWPNTLLRIPGARLRQTGLVPVDRTFEDGGFTIMDARMAFRIVAGNAITLAFGTDEAVKPWGPMKLPKSENLGPIINSMESDTIKMNVRHIEPET